jgi:anti-sigma B factor antagonist
LNGLAHVGISHRDGITIAAISGELDIANIEQVSGALRQLPNVADNLIVDMREVTYLDSSGVAVLHDLAVRLRERSQRLVVVALAGSPPRRILELTALHLTAAMVDELEPALATLRDTPWLLAVSAGAP